MTNNNAPAVNPCQTIHEARLVTAANDAVADVAAQFERRAADAEQRAAAARRTAASSGADELAGAAAAAAAGEAEAAAAACEQEAARLRGLAGAAASVRVQPKTFPYERFDAYLHIQMPSGESQCFGIGIQCKEPFLKQHWTKEQRERTVFKVQNAVVEDGQLALLFTGHALRAALAGELVAATAAGGARGAADPDALAAELRLQEDEENLEPGALGQGAHARGMIARVATACGLHAGLLQQLPMTNKALPSNRCHHLAPSHRVWVALQRFDPDCAQQHGQLPGGDR